MAYETIRTELVDGIAKLTLARPEKRNPIGPTTAGELVHALAAIERDPAARVVVLTGDGSVFSAGGDLGQMAGGVPSEAPPKSLVDLFLAMHALGKPILAMVNGHALAGGLGLVAACDVAIASETAELGMTEINLGLWPMMITAEVTHAVGRKVALDLMLTGRRIPAAEAQRLGLVTRVVPAAELEATTMAYAHALAAKSPTALRLGLRAFYATQDLPHEPRLRALEGELAKVLATEDAAEGVAAFFQKRAPVWRGR